MPRIGEVEAAAGLPLRAQVAVYGHGPGPAHRLA